MIVKNHTFRDHHLVAELGNKAILLWKHRSFTLGHRGEEDGDDIAHVGVTFSTYR